MHQMKYRVTLHAPVLISTFTDDNVTRSMSYIPGSAVLGAFAGAYLRKNTLSDAHQDENFFNWFLGDEVSFSNAYLRLANGSNDWQGLPIPLSIQQEKRTGRIINRIFDSPNEKAKSIPGYGWIEEDRLYPNEPKRRNHFHHARRDRLAGHSDKGSIFNYEALEAGQTFGGTLCGPLETLERFRECFGAKLNARLGRSRSAEYGEVCITLDTPEPIQYDEAVFGNYERNEVLISLLAPCILTNEYGYGEPSEKQFQLTLAAALGTKVDGIKIGECFAKTVKVENYLAVWGMKRPAVTALDAGSVFKVKFRDLTAPIRQRLMELAWSGLGERRNEGFGRFVLNYGYQEEYFKEKLSLIYDKPSGEPPESFRNLLATVLMQQLRQTVKTQAIKDAADFDSEASKSLTNSLLGRLSLMVSTARMGEVVPLLKKLRKPAVRQLERCKKGDKTLSQLMEGLDGNFANAIIEPLVSESGFKKLVKLSNFEVAKHHEELYQVFWREFFGEMRRINNAESEVKAHG